MAPTLPDGHGSQPPRGPDGPGDSAAPGDRLGVPRVPSADPERAVSLVPGRGRGHSRERRPASGAPGRGRSGRRLEQLGGDAASAVRRVRGRARRSGGQRDAQRRPRSDRARAPQPGPHAQRRPLGGQRRGPLAHAAGVPRLPAGARPRDALGPFREPRRARSAAGAPPPGHVPARARHACARCERPGSRLVAAVRGRSEPAGPARPFRRRRAPRTLARPRNVRVRGDRKRDRAPLDRGPNARGDARTSSRGAVRAPARVGRKRQGPLTGAGRRHGPHVALAGGLGPVRAQHAHPPVALDLGQPDFAEVLDTLQAQLGARLLLAHPFALEPGPLEHAVLHDRRGVALQQPRQLRLAVGDPGVRVVQRGQGDDGHDRAQEGRLAVDGGAGQVAHDERDQHVERGEVPDGAFAQDPDHRQHQHVDECRPAGDAQKAGVSHQDRLRACWPAVNGPTRSRDGRSRRWPRRRKGTAQAQHDRCSG